MKKLLRSLLLAALLTAALCVSALAADEPAEAGIYGIKPKENITVTPDTAGAEVEGYGTYYADAVKFEVSAKDLNSGSQYLLLVLKGDAATVTADSIVYIDQKAADADGSITFTAYPSALTKGGYKVYILGGDRTFTTGPAAEFSYYQPYTLGDVSGNTTIEAVDALYVLRAVAGLDQLTGTQTLAADMNQNGVVEAVDALLILRKVAGLD